MEAVVSDKAHLRTTSETIKSRIVNRRETRWNGWLRGGNVPNEMKNYPSPVILQEAVKSALSSLFFGKFLIIIVNCENSGISSKEFYIDVPFAFNQIKYVNYAAAAPATFYATRADFNRRHNR